MREKLIAAPVMTPAEFEALADALGWDVAVEQPFGFEAGVSQCGWDDELSDHWIEFQPVLRVANAEAVEFEAGESECGVDALTDLLPAADLECRVREVIGADLEPGYHYRDAAADPTVLPPPALGAAVFVAEGDTGTMFGVGVPFAEIVVVV